jgi:hypothetical protein
MGSITKAKLSGSTNGKMIKVVATATLGTTIHTAGSGTTNYDEVWLWAQNHDTTARLLTIEWGGATSPDCLVELTIPPQSGPVLVIPGWIIQNSLVVTAFCATANVVMIGGYVHTIAP